MKCKHRVIYKLVLDPTFSLFQATDPRAPHLSTAVNDANVQATTGLENTPGVMNVEQADVTQPKAVLALEADEDSDQDDFTSPGIA